MIIDTNVKIGRKSCTKYTDLETILEIMDKDGIQQAILSSYPHYNQQDEIIACLAAFPQRFSAFYMLDPWHDQQENIMQLLHKGYIGLVLDSIAYGYSLDDFDLLDPFLSICEAFGLLVWINTFSSFFSVCSFVQELAKTYPHVTFILGHMGFNYDASTACDLAAEYQNVYLETSGAMAINYRRAKDLCGAEKILFGSGFPEVNYPRLVIENIKDIFDASQCNLIFEDNFKQLIKKVNVCVSTC